MKDPDDLLKWIKEDVKMENFHNNSLEVRYNYFKNQFVDGQAFEQGLVFFKEQKTEEAITYAHFFQDLLENPEKMQDFIQDDEDDEMDFGNFVELEAWAKFFEEEVKIHYTILKKNGEETDRHSQQHKNGLAYLQENQQEILQNFLHELLKIYPSLQEQWRDFYTDEEKVEFMPDISDISGFAPLLSPTSLFVFSEYWEDLPYYSIGFHCSWEQEHGLGVVMHKNRVVKIVDASEVFEVYLAKEDLKKVK